MSPVVEIPGVDMRKATITICLLNGKVSVKSVDGELLLSGIAKDGFWDSLWTVLETDLRSPNDHLNYLR